MLHRRRHCVPPASECAHIAFSVAEVITSPRIAPKPLPAHVEPVQTSCLALRARTLLPGPTGSPSAFNLPGAPLVLSAAPAPASMGAASVARSPTAQQGASAPPDPCSVVTPLSPEGAEVVLRKYGIAHNWQHVIKGLRHRFDVGVCEPPLQTYIFRKSQIVLIRYPFHIIVHSIGVSSRLVLAWFCAIGT